MYDDSSRATSKARSITQLRFVPEGGAQSLETTRRTWPVSQGIRHTRSYGIHKSAQGKSTRERTRTCAGARQHEERSRRVVPEPRALGDVARVDRVRGESEGAPIYTCRSDCAVIGAASAIEGKELAIPPHDGSTVVVSKVKACRYRIGERVDDMPMRFNRHDSPSVAFE